jgi:hypothetical protein
MFTSSLYQQHNNLSVIHSPFLTKIVFKQIRTRRHSLGPSTMLLSSCIQKWFRLIRSLKLDMNLGMVNS